MAQAHPPEVLVENVFKLAMTGVGVVIAAMIVMSFIV